MAEARIFAELQETKAELQRLKERVFSGTPTAHKDLSLVALVPKWSGSESGTSLEEFISSIEGAAQVGLWGDSDRLIVAALRLSEGAKQFYNGCSELHSQGADWQTFKKVFRERYRDTHTEQYHFMKLQTARQSRNETPLEFADRCRSLAQKIVKKVDDPAAQKIHTENAKRMLLGSFINGLINEPGKYVRISNPQTLDQALKIALSVQEAVKQEKYSESFYANFDDATRLQTPSLTRSGSDRPHRSDKVKNAVNHTQTQRRMSTDSDRDSRFYGNRNEHTKAALRCYECKGFGHFARDCATRLRRETSSTNANPKDRTKRSRPPSSKPPPRSESRASKQATNQGNEK
jgi:hypothetical protein